MTTKQKKIEPNDLKTSNDMRELELMAKYEQLSDLILTRLHGKFECTIPKQTFMEKVFNGDKVHGDDYQKDEDLHIKLKIVPGSKLYRTELGPETEIAEITPPIHMVNQGFDYGRFPFAAEMREKLKASLSGIKLLFEKKKVGLKLGILYTGLWTN